MAEPYTADRRLYLTEDKSEVVEEGDPRAAFLLAAKGQDVDPAEVERLGLKRRAHETVEDKEREHEHVEDKATVHRVKR